MVVASNSHPYPDSHRGIGDLTKEEPMSTVEAPETPAPKFVLGGGLTPEDRSDACESFSRPRSWARKELHDEAPEAHAGADHPQVAGG